MNLANPIQRARMEEGGPGRSLPVRFILSMISIGYGAIVQCRHTLYQKNIFQTKKLPCVVISIGNLTVGGTGKTPMTIHLARMIKRLGYHVGVISRGYRGSAEKIGGVVCDGRTISMGPDIAGDEPFMIAKKLKSVPVLVGENRFKAGMRAVREFEVDVILLDDGFQHLRLERDVNLVLLDCKSPFGNGHLLPRGTLREPIGSLFRGDAFVLTRCDFCEDATINTSNRLPPDKPVFISSHRPFVSHIFKSGDISVESDLSESFTNNYDFLKGHPAVCFSGIARNNEFMHTVNNIGCTVTRFFSFSDHHRYSGQDLKKIAAAAELTNAEFILTTAKDFVRIPKGIKWPSDFVVIDVEISFGPDEDGFNEFIKSWIEGFKKKTNDKHV